ncbi:MAG: glycine/sarcosine/betaine reductase selenoprotein B family protein [Myxococcota bacterium]
MKDLAQRPPGSATREVDPWRFTGPFLTRVLSAQIPERPEHPPIPWAPVRRPVAESRIALVTTAGISMKGDRPFDMEMERRNPLRGDPSWRRIPALARTGSVEVNHLHIDTGYILRDLNVALPLERLHELTVERIVGEVAPSHYSIMGYQGHDTRELECTSAPEIAEEMRRERVDLALLAPV